MMTSAHPLLLLLLVLVSGGVARAQSDEDCVECHEEPGLEELPASVHGELGLTCVDCHEDLAGVELPHDDVEPVDCGICHETEEWTVSVHARQTEEEDEVAASCVDCHGSHDIRYSDDPASRVYHLNVSSTCRACHGDPELTAQGVKRIDQDRVHGETLRRAGLLVAPTCSTCHGAHRILPSENEDSLAHRSEIPSACGSCHEGVVRPYREDVHGNAVASGNAEAPVCNDCHTIHALERPRLSPWRVEVIEECGVCHEEAIETYRDTFHGQITELGYTRVATCADCHRAHGIYPPSNPKSSLSPENSVETCQECHSGAVPSFTLYDPHADPSDKDRSAVLYYVAQFMKYLLIGVFSFFGVHTLLWFPRSLQARRERLREEAAGST